MKVSLSAVLFVSLAWVAPAAENRVALKGGQLSIAIPAHWKRAENRPQTDETLGAFQSNDNTSGLFVSTVKTQPDYSLPRVMDEVVTNFEKGLIVNHIGKTKEGKLAGVFAVFCTLEIDLPSAKTRERKPFRFYLTLFETGGVVYLIQGSVQQPVKKEREQDILAIIRSVEKAAG